MKRLITFTGGLLALFAVGLASAEEFSGNVTLATDYRFRGISQGDRSPAIQGGVDLELDNGFYIGAWASNVTFSGGAIETDFYGGWSGAISETLNLDVGYLYYGYPEDDADPALDYSEVYASLSYSDFKVGLAYSPDYFAETDTFFYLYGEYSHNLTEAIALDVHVGLNKFAGDTEFASFIGPGPGEDPGDSYLDYSVGVSTAAFGLDLAAQFIGTNLNEDECFGDTKLCDDTIVLSVSKSL